MDEPLNENEVTAREAICRATGVTRAAASTQVRRELAEVEIVALVGIEHERTEALARADLHVRELLAAAAAERARRAAADGAHAATDVE